MPIPRGSMRSPIFSAPSRWKRRPMFQRAVSTGCGNFFAPGNSPIVCESSVSKASATCSKSSPSSAGDYLDHWFESAPIKAAFGFDAIVGNYASPYTPGSAYVLLHHCFGEVNGAKGQWGHAIGGMGAISEAMASAARARGVDIRTASPVREVLIEKGPRRRRRDGRGRNLPRQENHRQRQSEIALSRSRSAGGTARGFSRADHALALRLRHVPDECRACRNCRIFLLCPAANSAEHHTAGIIIAPSLRYMEDAYFDARRFGWSKKPIVEMLIPSTLDDTLAPRGAHVASLFCQHVAPELPDGKSWDDYREEVADLMIETVDAYAPNFKASVIARQIYSPLDLERTFGLIGGDIFHGALDLGQLFSARPMLGHADYRGPIPGLYMCGTGTHPGGGVTGLPGHNAAREILRDAKRF